MKLIVVAIVAAVSVAGCSKEEHTASKTAPSSQPLEIAPVAPPKSPEPKIDKGPWEGPFGLKMGLSEAELLAALPDLKTVRPNFFSTTTPPKAHDAFESYSLITSAPTGLCKIAAVGKDISTSGFGDELKSAHMSMKDALTEKYGKPTDHFDFLKHGSIWTERKYWVMGMLKKDRTLMTAWQQKTAKNPKGVELPNNIMTIVIESEATQTDTGYISVRYEFSNLNECFEANSKEKNKAL